MYKRTLAGKIVSRMLFLQEHLLKLVIQSGALLDENHLSRSELLTQLVRYIHTHITESTLTKWGGRVVCVFIFSVRCSFVGNEMKIYVCRATIKNIHFLGNTCVI